MSIPKIKISDIVISRSSYLLVEDLVHMVAVSFHSRENVYSLWVLYVSADNLMSSSHCFQNRLKHVQDPRDET